MENNIRVSKNTKIMWIERMFGKQRKRMEHGRKEMRYRKEKK